MTTIVFDPAAFRANPLFVAYSQDPPWTNAVLTAWSDVAHQYISDQNGGCYVFNMRPGQQALAINLMVAHLIALTQQIGNTAGVVPKTPGLKQAATIDKVSVTLTPPPVKNQWQWWLSLTPFGQQLLGLLQIASVGGAFFGARAVGPIAFR